MKKIMEFLKRLKGERSWGVFIFAIICLVLSITALLGNIINEKLGLAWSINSSILLLFLAQFAWCIERWTEKTMNFWDNKGFWRWLFGVKWRIAEFKRKIKSDWFRLIKRVFGLIFLIIFYHGFGIKESGFDGIAEAVVLYSTYVVLLGLFTTIYIGRIISSCIMGSKKKKIDKDEIATGLMI